MSDHVYHIETEWTGNLGKGTVSYKAFSRDYTLHAEGKPVIEGSSDPAFRGDPARWNPEDLLVASASACHKLWYLHLCAINDVVVMAYHDHAVGRMAHEQSNSEGHFTEILLRPEVRISAKSDADLALKLHEQAHHKCFIANSVNFPIRCEAQIIFT